MKNEFKKIYIENTIGKKNFKVINENNIQEILLDTIDDFIIDLTDRNIIWFLSVKNFIENNKENINFKKKNMYVLRTNKFGGINNLVIKKVNKNQIISLAYQIEWESENIDTWIPIESYRESRSGDSFVFYTKNNVFTIKYWNLDESEFYDQKYLYLKFSKKDIEKQYEGNGYIRLTSVQFKNEEIDFDSFIDKNFKNPISFNDINFYTFRSLEETSTILVNSKSQFEKWTLEYENLPKKVQRLYDFVNENYYNCKIAVAYITIENKKWILKKEEFQIPNKKLLN